MWAFSVLEILHILFPFFPRKEGEAWAPRDITSGGNEWGNRGDRDLHRGGLLNHPYDKHLGSKSKIYHFFILPREVLPLPFWYFDIRAPDELRSDIAERGTLASTSDTSNDVMFVLPLIFRNGFVFKDLSDLFFLSHRQAPVFLSYQAARF